jgi:sulfatase modifying factor 1
LTSTSESMSNCCAPSRTGKSTPEEKVNDSDSAGKFDLSGMSFIPSGSFHMGSDSDAVFRNDGEGPVREVHLNSFWISKTTVSNGEFLNFVNESGYVTEAERIGWSFVFEGQLKNTPFSKHSIGRSEDTPWWVAVQGAFWANPLGPGSSIIDLYDHPVVHISWNDSRAYANWRGMRLPTEAEWERAARGSLTQCDFPWGNELVQDGIHHCNVWQGEFPKVNLQQDGYLATAPVDSFKPNDFGLYNVTGNVWEWTADWFSQFWHVEETPITRSNPEGPASGEMRVTKGGSFLCHDSYCTRYRLSARSRLTPDSSLSHTGFRIACDDIDESSTQAEGDDALGI